MPKINPRIKSIDDLLGLDAAEESPTLIFLLCMLTRGWNTPNCAIS